MPPTSTFRTQDEGPGAIFSWWRREAPRALPELAMPLMALPWNKHTILSPHIPCSQSKSHGQAQSQWGWWHGCPSAQIPSGPLHPLSSCWQSLGWLPTITHWELPLAIGNCLPQSHAPPPRGSSWPVVGRSMETKGGLLPSIRHNPEGLLELQSF